jgi:hypothetical protein
MRDVFAYELSATVPDEHVVERIRELLSEIKFQIRELIYRLDSQFVSGQSP